MLTKTGNINLIASTTFFSALICLGSQCVEMGVTETFGIEATAAFARNDQPLIFKKFKQSIIVQTVLLAVFYVLPCFFIENLMALLAVHEEVN